MLDLLPVEAVGLWPKLRLIKAMRERGREAWQAARAAAAAAATAAATAGDRLGGDDTAMADVSATVSK